MAPRFIRLYGGAVKRAAVTIVVLSHVTSCTFDSEVPGIPDVELPLVICDRRASPCSVAERNTLAWIGDFGDDEFIDTSLGTASTTSQPIADGTGCQYEGRMSVPASFPAGRLLALDEDDWVAECTPGASLFSIEKGQLVIGGTAVFHRGEAGCQIRTANFCS